MYKYYYMNEYLKYICKKHDDKKNEQMLSPCRYKCIYCKKKKYTGEQQINGPLFSFFIVSSFSSFVKSSISLGTFSLQENSKHSARGVPDEVKHS